MNYLMIFLGGGAGSIARFMVTKFTMKFSGAALFPAGTLAANILASVLMILIVNQFKINGRESLYLLLVTGFCGGFSTFSAFSYETASLLNSGNYFIAVLNIFISVVACTGLAFLLMRSA